MSGRVGQVRSLSVFSGLVRRLLGEGGGLGLFLGCAQPVAVGPGLDDVGVEGEPVDDGGGQAGVGERPAPFAEGVVAGHADRCSFFAFGQDLEEQLGAAGVDADVAELVDQEQVEVNRPGFDGGSVYWFPTSDWLVCWAA